jgi:hypothetical protein
MKKIETRYLWLRPLCWCAVFFTLNACIEHINFDSPPPEQLIIVDGYISDEEGPYVVRITRGLSLNADSSLVDPVAGAKVALYSDANESENMVEERDGKYVSTGTIRGVVGRTYHITIEMPDGSTFESLPETIKPTGEVTNITFQYEKRVQHRGTEDVAADVFNIFIDADASVNSDDKTAFVRWRFTGIYKVLTNPQNHVNREEGPPYMTPYACSGYEVLPGLGGGILAQFRPCTCCECYAHQYDIEPVLSDLGLVENGQFRNVKVAEIPITGNTFYEKVMLQIEQMSISRNAFDFYKLIRNQKENASNLFQPPAGEVRGNIVAVKANYNVIGLFAASSIHKATSFIHRDDVPYTPPPVSFVTQPCTVYPHSVTTKPANWDE